MVRSNRVQSTDLKDPKVEILAGIAARDNIYQNNVDHIENQDSLNLIHNTSLAAPGALAHRLQRRTVCNTSPPALSKMADGVPK